MGKSLLQALADYFHAIECPAINGKVVRVYLDQPEHFMELREARDVTSHEYPIHLWGATVMSGRPKIVYESEGRTMRIGIPSPLTKKYPKKKYEDRR